MKKFQTFILLLITLGASALYAQTTATPVITPTTGAYPMPQNVTISDSTTGGVILWCYATTGTCTPASSYTSGQNIYLDPTTTETICANAKAPSYSVSATACNYYTRAITATPVISLASGTYPMPQNTTISDTTGAVILWCYDTSGSCTPVTTYTTNQSIYIDPSTTETICANASETGYQQGSTTCNSYTAGSGAVTFSYADGDVTMSTNQPYANIFYTLDGSTATEASIEYTVPFAVAPGTVINAVAVTTTSGGNTGVTVQNGQYTWADWKTNLACYQEGMGDAQGQCTAVSQCSSTTTGLCSPDLKYCLPSQGNTTNQGCLGVQGVPTQVGMTTAGTLPTALGKEKTANFSLTTPGYPDASPNGTAGGTSEYYGTQVLWPYNTAPGCDSCTTLVEDFYVWPEHTSSVDAGNVQNWELDMNSWKHSDLVYLGASMQCSNQDGGWEYNGQALPGWTFFNLNGTSKTVSPITQDCQFPFGTLSAAITSATQTSFTVTPNQTTIGTKHVTAAGVEPGMIVKVDNEEIFCGTGSSGSTCSSATRGWAGTTASTHSSGAYYEGSVHVQYHVTFKPGDTTVCLQGSAHVECIFIDYLIINNHEYNFHTIYGEQPTLPGYSLLTVPAFTLDSSWPDSAFDQKQIDVWPLSGSTSNPVQVGEFTDQDNVTASFGVAGAASYTVP